MAWIEPRDKAGLKWRLCVNDGSNDEGRVRHRRIFYGNEDQAKKAADKFEYEIKNGLYFPEGDKATLATFIKTWKSDYAESELAIRTFERYEKLIEVGILPYLGQIKLNRINPVAVNKWRKKIEKMPRKDGKGGTLSAQTIKHYYACLSAILGKAVQWEIIKSNPCEKAETPKVPKAKVKVFNEEEAAIFIQRLEEKADLKHRSLTWLEIDTGMRREEIMGLEWDDIDFDKKTVYIHRTSQYSVKKGVFSGPTKNDSSTRRIAVADNVMDLLKEYKGKWDEHKDKLKDLWKGSNRLFTTWDGRDGYPGMPQTWLQSFLEREKLPHCSFHSLRHLSATLQIKAEVPLSQVSKRLGHSEVGTTSTVYEEVIESVDREAAEKIGNLLEQMKKSGGQSGGTDSEKTPPNVIDFEKRKANKARKNGTLD